jgi:sulfotransferase
VERQTFFLAGLPRSGFTLLLNILGQNPGIHVTPTSGILDILVDTRNCVAFKAIPWEEGERTLCQVQRHIMEGYFEHIEKPVCIDKNRGWPWSVGMKRHLPAAAFLPRAAGARRCISLLDR